MLRKSYRVRLHFILLIPLLAVACLIPRLYNLQVTRHDEFVKLADGQHSKPIEIIPCRGKILDRNGHELAGSILLESAYVAPRHIPGEYAAPLAHDLSTVVGVPYDKIYKRLTGKSEVPIARKLDESRVTAVRDVMAKYRRKVPASAIYFVQEGKRFYSRGSLASHIVGYVTLDDTGDNKGLAGIELTYDEELRGKVEKVRVRTNAVSNFLEPVDPNVLISTFGNSVVLTIDDAIQAAAESAIVNAVQSNSADAGTVVVMRVKTGEVLAMANCPSFSVDDTHAAEFTRRNRAVTDAIEPGSVMKIFTFTSLLDDDKVRLDEIVNCEGGAWSVHGRRITDSHRMGSVPVREVFAESSNVGSVKMGLRLTSQRFFQHLTLFGFGNPTGIDLPGESEGRLKNPRRWSLQTGSSVPMGYELQLTAIQICAAVSGIVNKGIYIQPHVVREIRDFRGDLVRRVELAPPRRICSTLTSQRMLEMMEGVVLHGTGKTAAMDNYRVGGKTGTTKKIDPETRQYGRAYIASFCGVAPVEDPEICVYSWVDNPRGGQFYGGQVAAPVFKDVAEVALKVLKVPALKELSPNSTMEVALDRIRTELDGKVPAAYLDGRRDEAASTGTMPNLEGLTMQEATRWLADLGIPFDYSGSGVVADQMPGKFETIERGERAQIRFVSRESYLSQVASTARSMASAAPPGEDLAADLPGADSVMLVRGGKSAEVKLAVDEGMPRSSAPALPRPVITGHGAPAVPPPAANLDPAADRALNKDAAKQVWASWAKEQDKAKSAPASQEGQPAARPEIREERDSRPQPDADPVSAYDLPESQRGPVEEEPGD